MIGRRAFFTTLAAGIAFFKAPFAVKASEYPAGEWRQVKFRIDVFRDQPFPSRIITANILPKVDMTESEARLAVVRCLRTDFDREVHTWDFGVSDPFVIDEPPETEWLQSQRDAVG